MKMIHIDDGFDDGFTSLNNDLRNNIYGSIKYDKTSNFSVIVKIAVEHTVDQLLIYANLLNALWV